MKIKSLYHYSIKGLLIFSLFCLVNVVFITRASAEIDEISALINSLNSNLLRKGNQQNVYDVKLDTVPWLSYVRENKQSVFGIDTNINYYLFGCDKEIARSETSRQYLGISFNVSEGTAKTTISDSDMDYIAFGVYYAKLCKNGHFFDLFLSQGRYTEDVKCFLDTETPTLESYRYGQNDTCVTSTYGYFWYIGETGFYIEPQFSLAWDYSSSAQTNANTGTHIKFNANHKFYSRIGIEIGKGSKNFSYFVRVCHFYDWGGASLTMVHDNIPYAIEQAKNWWEVAIGGAWHISNTTHFHVEVSKLYKDIQNSLNFNFAFNFIL